MEIKIDYYLSDSTSKNWIMHTTVTEEDIVEMLESKFRSGDLACPIYFDRETVKFEANIDKVII